MRLKSKLDIFISRPTEIAEGFDPAYDAFIRYLKAIRLNPRRLGSSDFSLDAPLKAVIGIMKECKGAVILGYPQYTIISTITRGNDVNPNLIYSFPTPWNHIEASLAFQQGIPVLVIAQEGIKGGIFDHGESFEIFALNHARHSGESQNPKRRNC